MNAASINHEQLEAWAADADKITCSSCGHEVNQVPVMARELLEARVTIRELQDLVTILEVDATPSRAVKVGDVFRWDPDDGYRQHVVSVDPLLVDIIAKDGDHVGRVPQSANDKCRLRLLGFTFVFADTGEEVAF